MPAPLLVTFVGGSQGVWKLEALKTLCGEALATVERLAMHEGPVPATQGLWALKGVTGQARYTERKEKEALEKVQAPLGRPEALCAALIPIKKTQAWWDLAQDERRRIFEEQSRHIGLSMDYLPAVARRLHHSRDLAEPFDFLTWFEFAPEYSGRFDELLVKLRASEEWKYVEREVEIRLRRE